LESYAYHIVTSDSFEYFPDIDRMLTVPTPLYHPCLERLHLYRPTATPLYRLRKDRGYSL
jgi:hypothetical protein